MVAFLVSLFSLLVAATVALPTSPAAYQWIPLDPSKFAHYTSTYAYSSGPIPYTIISADGPARDGNQIYVCAVEFPDSSWAIGYFESVRAFACNAIYKGTAVRVDDTPRSFAGNASFLSLNSGFDVYWEPLENITEHSGLYRYIYAPDGATFAGEVCSGHYASAAGEPSYVVPKDLPSAVSKRLKRKKPRPEESSGQQDGEGESCEGLQVGAAQKGLFVRLVMNEDGGCLIGAGLPTMKKAKLLGSEGKKSKAFHPRAMPTIRTDPQSRFEVKSVFKDAATALTCQDFSFLQKALAPEKLFAAPTLPQGESYASLELEMHNAGDGDSGEEARAWCLALRNYTLARNGLVKFYTTCAEATPEMDYAAMLGTIAELEILINLDRTRSLFGTPGTNIEMEILVLKNIFLSELAVRAYNFKEASLHYFIARNTLDKWERCIEAGVDPSESDRNLRRVNVIVWLMRFIDSIGTKIGIYFQRILQERHKQLVTSLRPTAGGDAAETPACLQLLVKYWKQTRPFNISLIYLITDDKPFFRNGYACCPPGSYEKPTGIQSFPAVCSFPSSPPMEHWPNIISILQSHDRLCDPPTPRRNRSHSQSSSSSVRSLAPSMAPATPQPTRKQSTASLAAALAASALLPSSASSASSSRASQADGLPLGRRLHFHDRKVETTYILARVDARVVVSIIFSGKLPAGDPATNEFLERLVAVMGHFEVFRLLRSEK
ncbi:hypothetical protein BDK51DRAFT_30514 [Blyttiomyces helicus]|uniref:Uncharacterized protein n=1 Tax=Blyttiomyces helicus TaxID=388810 RepID=A0A4P9WJA2_9FUNG|nr:hypothetical protein BDK51DRAFT_30514 [Blyttiomyces helicus]|eukprot:RKO90686.1 hypothetical protein BDK51DRAFT_30514 [Blyttiomyces helicus]